MRQGQIGVIRAGLLADFIVLPQDPFEMDVERIHTIAPSATVVGGEMHSGSLPTSTPDFDGDGEVGFDDFFLFADHFGQPARAKLLVMAQELIGLPDDVQLHQNVPNPFNRQTLISFLMLAPGPARVELFALTGQRVAVLSQGFRRAGSHRLHWDGRDDDDRPLASGTYLYRLVTTDGTVTRKLTLLR